MPSQASPQSRWLRSFILYSVLACVCIAVLAIFATSLVRRVLRRVGATDSTQALRSDVRPNALLPAETAGWDNVIANLLSAFDHVDVIALGEAHGRKVDSDLRLRLIRDPDFPFRAHFIIVEFGNSLYQATLDHYIYGDDVPPAAVEQVWRNTTQIAGNDSPVYAEFYAAVREVNLKLPPARRLRVIAGDPPIDWDKVQTKEDFDPFLLRRAFPVSVGRVVVPRGEKALVIYGSAHLKRPTFPLRAAEAESRVDGHPEAPLPPTVPPIFKALQVSSPGRVLVVKTIAGLNPFQTTLQLGELPVLIPLTGMHSAVSSDLGDEADACIYFGDGPDVAASVAADPGIYRGTPYGAEIARRQKAVETTTR